jgi:hypothetical protein
LAWGIANTSLRHARRKKIAGHAMFAIADFDVVADADFAALDYVAVQGKRAVELAHDLFQHAEILMLRIRIESGHYAALTKILNPDQYFSDAHALPRPGAFVEAGNATNDNVGPEPPAIVAKRDDGAIGCHQKWKHVESRSRIIADQARSWPGNIGDEPLGLRGSPRQVVDLRFAGWIECGVMSEKARMGSRGYKTSGGIFHVNDAIAGDAKRAENSAIEFFARH